MVKITSFQWECTLWIGFGKAEYKYILLTKGTLIWHFTVPVFRCLACPAVRDDIGIFQNSYYRRLVLFVTATATATAAAA